MVLRGASSPRTSERRTRMRGFNQHEAGDLSRQMRREVTHLEAAERVTDQHLRRRHVCHL